MPTTQHPVTTRYALRLVEQVIEEDSGDFAVDAPTPERAAAVLLAAHDRARARGSNLVRLPDGQARRIEPDNVVRTRVFCVLLDESGQELHEVEPDHGEQPAAKGGHEGRAR
jgi:hypothetical protein